MLKNSPFSSISLALFTLAIFEAIIWNVPLVESASQTYHEDYLLEYYKRESENLKSFILESNDIDPTIPDISDSYFYEQTEMDRLKEYVTEHSNELLTFIRTFFDRVRSSSIEMDSEVSPSILLSNCGAQKFQRTISMH